MRPVCVTILATLEDMLILYRGKSSGGYVQGCGHDHLTDKTDRSRVWQACKHDPGDSANNLREKESRRASRGVSVHDLIYASDWLFNCGAVQLRR